MEPNQTTPITPVAPVAPVAPAVAPAPATSLPDPMASKDQPTEQTVADAQTQKTAPKLDEKTGEIIRYPFLVIMIVALRLLSLVFILIGIIAGLSQLFVTDLPIWYRVGLMFLYMMLGIFQGILCWVMSEGIKVWLDTERQTRPKAVDDELRAMLNQK